MTLVLNDDIFPRNLIYLRKKKKLSQKQLALQSGITVYYLRGIEHGRFRSQLPLSQYMSLCRILCVCPSLMGCYDLQKLERQFYDTYAEKSTDLK